MKADALAGTLGLDQGRGGRIVVGADLSLPDDPTVFVVGDLAAASSADGRLLPQLAPVAIQEGRHVARQIRRRLERRQTTGFRYRSKGLMATICRGSGVAELPLGVSCTARAAGWRGSCCTS